MKYILILIITCLAFTASSQCPDYLNHSSNSGQNPTTIFVYGDGGVLIDIYENGTKIKKVR